MPNDIKRGLMILAVGVSLALLLLFLAYFLPDIPENLAKGIGGSAGLAMKADGALTIIAVARATLNWIKR